MTDQSVDKSPVDCSTPDMKEDSNPRSRSSARHFLYYNAFGDASRDERRSIYCSPAALTLKRQRRKLFNNLLDSETGAKRLLKGSLDIDTDGFMPSLIARQKYKIKVESDDESGTEDIVRKRKVQKRGRRSQRETSPTTKEKQKLTSRPLLLNDDMPEIDEKYPSNIKNYDESDTLHQGPNSQSKSVNGVYDDDIISSIWEDFNMDEYIAKLAWKTFSERQQTFSLADDNDQNENRKQDKLSTETRMSDGEYP